MCQGRSSLSETSYFLFSHQGFQVPLSHEDGAARVYHPVWHGLQEDSQPYFATFLKNFKPHPW